MEKQTKYIVLAGVLVILLVGGIVGYSIYKDSAKDSPCISSIVVAEQDHISYYSWGESHGFCTDIELTCTNINGQLILVKTGPSMDVKYKGETIARLHVKSSGGYYSTSVDSQSETIKVYYDLERAGITMDKSTMWLNGKEYSLSMLSFTVLPWVPDDTWQKWMLPGCPVKVV